MTILLYAYFIKICVAEHAGLITDSIFNHAILSGYSVILGTLCFSLQIYSDFMSYSLMAYGFGLLLGFELSINFNLPYWALNPKDFWTRWHITLSQWIRDYIYIPLGGSRISQRRTYVNVLTAMGLSGLWHGASWNFVIWGLWHGVAVVLYDFLRGSPQSSKPKIQCPAFLSWLITMIIVVIGWAMFRITSMPVLRNVLVALENWEILPATRYQAVAFITLSVPIFLAEWHQRRTKSRFPLISLPKPILYVVVSAMTACTLAFFKKETLSFIYFQF